MAGAEYLYTEKWEEYSEFVEWAKKHGEFADGVSIIDFVREHEKKDFDGRKLLRVVWYADNRIRDYLLAKCPVRFVQQAIAKKHKKQRRKGKT